MLKNLLILPGGREISSGTAGVGIGSVTLTQTVNAGEELTLGSVCASMLEATLYDGGQLSLACGDEVTLYKLDDAGNRRKIGIFILEKPVRAGKNTYKILGYDRVSLLDRDVSEWLNSLSGWPYTLEQIAYMAAKNCGLDIVGTFHDRTVEKFTARGITARKLIEWVGQATGQLCRANADGVLEFFWYTPSPETTLTVMSRTSADYAVAPIDNVRIALTEDDVGVCYPGSGENTYSVVGNYLLAGQTREQLLAVAQGLYAVLRGVSYTPCTIKALAEQDLQPGHIVKIGDITTYVMTKVQTGQIETLSSTGSYNRSCATAQNETSYKSLSGQVLEVKAEIDGLRVENRKGEEALAKLDLQLGGITAEVARQAEQNGSIQSQLTQLSQTASDISLSVKQIQEGGVTKVENEFGLTIDGSAVTIHRSGSEMENKLDETGMYVNRGDTPMLRANDKGVLATDVTVRNFLIVGDHARFEDYGTGRTACYWR